MWVGAGTPSGSRPGALAAKATVIEPNIPEAKLSMATTYGQFGTVDSVTRTDNAGESRMNTFEYGNADRLYPTATSNALGHRTVIETHSSLGVPIRIADPNCVPVTMRYDRFGRLREINRADGSFEHIAQAYFGLQPRRSPTPTAAWSSPRRITWARIVHNSFNTFDGGTAVITTNYDTLSPNGIGKPVNSTSPRRGRHVVPLRAARPPGEHQVDHR